MSVGAPHAEVAAFVRYYWPEARVRRGVLAAVGATLVFLVLPALVPMAAYQQFLWETTGTWTFHNPFEGLRALSGVVGGVVAGYYARDSIRGAADGARVGVYSAALLYVLQVGYNALRVPLVYGTAPPVYDTLFLPLAIWLVLLPVYAVGGLLGGFLAGWLA